MPENFYKNSGKFSEKHGFFQEAPENMEKIKEYSNITFPKTSEVFGKKKKNFSEYNYYKLYLGTPKS